MPKSEVEQENIPEYQKDMHSIWSESNFRTIRSLSKYVSFFFLIVGIGNLFVGSLDRSLSYALIFLGLLLVSFYRFANMKNAQAFLSILLHATAYFEAFRAIQTGGDESPLLFWFFTIIMVNYAFIKNFLAHAFSIQVLILFIVVNVYGNCIDCVFSEIPRFFLGPKGELLVKVSALVIAIFVSFILDRQRQNWYLRYLDKHAQIKTQKHLASLGQLAAGIAHEINNPLAVIRGNLQMAMRKLKDKKSVEDSLNEGLVHLDRIGLIIESLQTMSRPSVGKDSEICKLVEVVESIVVLQSRLLEEEDIELIIEIPEEVKLQADRVQIGQIFSNLILNSIHALKGRNDKKIIIQYRSKDQEVSFRDNGPGIQDEIKNRVFDPFFTTREVGDGTGLGLAISQKFAHENKMVLHYNPEFKNGAEFVLKVNPV